MTQLTELQHTSIQSLKIRESSGGWILSEFAFGTPDVNNRNVVKVRVVAVKGDETREKTFEVDVHGRYKG